MKPSLEITVAVPCPEKCSFCPQQVLALAYKGDLVMKLETLKRCLKTVPSNCRVDFTGFCEPLVHTDFGAMLQYVKSQGHSIHLFTTLIGLNHAKLDQIKKVAPEHICIHCPDEVGFFVDDDKWILLHTIWLRARIPATYMAMGRLTPKVKEHLDYMCIHVERPTMLCRGGSLWKINHLQGEIRCAADRWHNNVLLPNGDVQICCMDFGLTMCCGNLLRQPYSEIEKTANEFAANHNPPDNCICRSCEWCTTK